MMRSPYVDLFELELVRGRARADLEALAAAAVPFQRAVRQLGVSFQEAARNMAPALERLGVGFREASRNLAESLERSGIRVVVDDRVPAGTFRLVPPASDQ